MECSLFGVMTKSHSIGFLFPLLFFMPLHSWLSPLNPCYISKQQTNQLTTFLSYAMSLKTTTVQFIFIMQELDTSSYVIVKHSA